MKSLSFFALAAVCTASALHAQTTPDNYVAQGGTRIGRVFLGDTQGAVLRRLGKPAKTFTLPNGYSSHLWRSKTTADTGQRNTLEVVYRGGVVRQIEGTSLVWTAPGGLSLASTRAAWEKIYGIPTQTTYYFDALGQRKRYLDWKRSGIALELVQDAGAEEWTFQTLIIHRKNYAVLPDRGGERE